MNEWKEIEFFLVIFNSPRFASGYDQNQLIIFGISKENKHRVKPEPMSIVPKGDKRNNQQKLINQFTKDWTRITNNRMTDSNAENNWMIPRDRKVAKNGIFH